ncbi:hypothetical protein LEMLEM_LOCUS8523 [Lemmus lemmus]
MLSSRRGDDRHGRLSEDEMQRDLKVAKTGLSRLQARVSAVTRS